jgi:hypothetical protein
VNPQDPLASLHPLREPPPIGWWPPAPGWWLLAGLILLALLTLTFILVRRYPANAYRRQGLAQLQRLRSEFQREQDSQRYLAGANALLKSVALVAYPRRDVAACSGDQWLDFLNAGLEQNERFPEGFVTGAYQRATPRIDMEQVHRAAESWIRRHGVAR